MNNFPKKKNFINKEKINEPKENEKQNPLSKKNKMNQYNNAVMSNDSKNQNKYTYNKKRLMKKSNNSDKNEVDKNSSNVYTQKSFDQSFFNKKEKEKENIRESLINDINSMKREIQKLSDKLNIMEEKLINSKNEDFIDINSNDESSKGNISIKPNSQESIYYNPFKNSDKTKYAEDGLNFNLYNPKEENNSKIPSDINKNNKSNTSSKIMKKQKDNNSKRYNDSYLNKKRKDLINLNASDYH